MTHFRRGARSIFSKNVSKLYWMVWRGPHCIFDSDIWPVLRFKCINNLAGDNLFRHFWDFFKKLSISNLVLSPVRSMVPYIMSSELKNIILTDTLTKTEPKSYHLTRDPQTVDWRSVDACIWPKLNKIFI